MEIRTKAVFLNEQKEKYEVDYIFNLFSVLDASSTDEGYTIITIETMGNNVEVKIKFETFWGMIEKNNLKCQKIIE